MKPGDLVRNKNSESGELGIFMGMRTFKRMHEVGEKLQDRGDYECAEVYWPKRLEAFGTIQTNLVEVISEAG